MKAPDTRPGGRHEARERGAYDREREVKERRDECPPWCWRLGEKYGALLRELLNGNQSIGRA